MPVRIREQAGEPRIEDGELSPGNKEDTRTKNASACTPRLSRSVYGIFGSVRMLQDHSVDTVERAPSVSEVALRIYGKTRAGDW
jgi:hypothetical protein